MESCYKQGYKQECESPLPPISCHSRSHSHTLLTLIITGFRAPIQGSPLASSTAARNAYGSSSIPGSRKDSAAQPSTPLPLNGRDLAKLSPEEVHKFILDTMTKDIGFGSNAVTVAGMESQVVVQNQVVVTYRLLQARVCSAIRRAKTLT